MHIGDMMLIFFFSFQHFMIIMIVAHPKNKLSGGFLKLSGSYLRILIIFWKENVSEMIR